MCFIDAIHTSEVVFSQFETVLRLANKHALIIFDDINVSEDMADAWKKLALDPRVVASAALGDRVGIVEVRS